MSSDAAADHHRRWFASRFVNEARRFSLVSGSRVAVLGGGPAGSLFAYFVRRLGKSADVDIAVDVYEPRFFTHRGAAGCNHCGGVVSESLVQLLATEGINLPPGVVQRGIESYVLHMDVGDVRIETPSLEKRIASVFRGNGPREPAHHLDIAGFDNFLLDLSCSIGANVVRQLATGVRMQQDRLEVSTPDGPAGSYDLIAVATGVNSRPIQVGSIAPRHEPPGTQRTFICEFDLGEETVRQSLGDSMHVFLLDFPRLEFAALVPKGRFVTLCLVGAEIDEELVERFLATPEVLRCFPQMSLPWPACHCFPRINTAAAARPFGDRLVWIGDAGVARLYKDGIGSAYRTAKAAAKTAVFHGIAARDFEKHFWPECRALIVDNAIAKVIFGATALIQRMRFVRRGVLRMTTAEQCGTSTDKPMSSVLWDVFTGSAPYGEILFRMLRPSFPATLAWNLIAGNAPGGKVRRAERYWMGMNSLGRIYRDREIIVRQGDAGDCMFAIQAGRVEVVREIADGEVQVGMLQEEDIFGEMAILQKEVRSATVRAIGEARVLTIDKKTFLRRVREDPLLALNLAGMLCARVRHLDAEVASLKHALAAREPVGSPSAKAASIDPGALRTEKRMEQADGKT